MKGFTGASARPWPLGRFSHAPRPRRHSVRHRSAPVPRRARWACSSTTGASTSATARARSSARLPGAGHADCVAPPAPSTSAARLERVFAYLRSKNIKNVELYGYPGNPFPGTNPATPLNTAGLQALRALGDSYGLSFVARHGNIAEANWDQEIQAAKILGQEVIGAADPPGIGNLTYQGALISAQLMNRLGKRSVEAGVGPVYFHNHATSFNRKFTDAGVPKYPWEILMDRTDPRYVSRPDRPLLDSPPASPTTRRSMLDMVNRYTEPPVRLPRQGRHQPDAVRRHGQPARARRRRVNFAPIFAAAKNRVKYYLYEYDPVTRRQQRRLQPVHDDRPQPRRPDRRPGSGARAPTRRASPRWRPARAAASNQVPSRSPTGRRPARHHAAAPTIAADADDGGNATAGDFAVVSQDCSAATAASPLAAGRHVHRSTSASSRRAPTTRRSRACSSPRTPTTRSTACCWSARAPATPSAPSAATSRPCSR